MNNAVDVEAQKLVEEIRRLRSILSEVQDIVGWFDADNENPVTFRNELWVLVG